MTSMTILFIFIFVLNIIFISLNFLFAPHNPYPEKYSIFECGYHSFVGQNRIQFGIKFFIFALLYLLFDLEIVLIYPYAVSAYENSTYGLSIIIIFILIVSAGFMYELGKNALKIDSRQFTQSIVKSIKSITITQNKILILFIKQNKN
jgi:NADH-ubiquinone oxidoreductase chain 3